MSCLKIFGEGKTIIPVDYHIHSNFSDGKNTIEEYIISAKNKRLREIAITDHVWRNSKWIGEYISQIRVLRRSYNFKILAGVEAKVIDFNGNVDISKETRKKVDFVMGVVHRFFPAMDNSNNDILNFSAKDAAQLEAELTMKMIANPEVDIIGHPTRTYYKFYYLKGKTKKEFPKSLISKICRTALQFNKILEYNPNLPSTERLMDSYLELKVPFTIGTDAHDISAMGNVDYEKINEKLRRGYGI